MLGSRENGKKKTRRKKMGRIWPFFLVGYREKIERKEKNICSAYENVFSPLLEKKLVGVILFKITIYSTYSTD